MMICLFADLPRAFNRLLRNPIFLITCLGICCEVCIVSGFVVFLPKYLETQFTLSKSKANLLTGERSCPFQTQCTHWTWNLVD